MAIRALDIGWRGARSCVEISAIQIASCVLVAMALRWANS
jgi:hypothetical protein